MPAKRKERKNPIMGHGRRAVDWPGTIKRAARFCFEPKRFIPFFITDVLVITVAFLLIGGATMPYGGLAAGSLPLEADSAIVMLAILIIAWFMVTLWIMGAVIHQSSKPKEFDRSWLVSARMYPNLLAATAIVAVITIILSSVPQVGLLLSIVASLAFLFVIQFVIVGGMKFHQALAMSLKTLRYKFLAVFLSWLIGGLLSLAIMLVFASPLIATVLYFVATYGMEDAILYMMVSLDWSVIYVESGVLLLGLSISRTFGLNFLTGVYLQLNRKRFFIF